MTLQGSVYIPPERIFFITAEPLKHLRYWDNIWQNFLRDISRSKPHLSTCASDSFWKFTDQLFYILKAAEHEYIFSKYSRNLNMSEIFWACYTRNNFPIIFTKYKTPHFLKLKLLFYPKHVGCLHSRLTWSFLSVNWRTLSSDVWRNIALYFEFLLCQTMLILQSFIWWYTPWCCFL